MELVGPNMRKWVGNIIQIVLTCGNLYLVLVVYLIRDWKYYELALSLPLILCLSYYWYKYTVKPVLRHHIKQDIFLAFQTGGCLLLHEGSAESRSFLRYFHLAISNHLSIVISMSPELMVA